MSSGQRQQQQRRHPKASTSSSGASSSSSAHHPQHQQHQQAAAQAAAVHLLPASQLSSHTAELTTFIQTTFVPSVSPSPDEFTAKENAFAFLATLVERVAPGAKLKPFGSMANGFALQNSDMDLVCLQSDQSPPRPASDMVEELGALIQAETNFQVKMLPRARIPIIKLTMPPTSTTPFSLACDIGFDNKLALSNTKLLYTYAKCDHRLRSLVLFIKVWTKKRQINSPYRGTLSSYGYVLLVIHFLVHVKQPPVLPNLQRLPLTRNYELHELEAEGHDIYFMDDLDSLSLWWKTSNNDTVGELLVDFFRHYAHQFDYNRLVLSLRSENGYVTKESKGWHLDVSFSAASLGLLFTCVSDTTCISKDPFQTDYNVARTVTRDGLYTIRGEFMRALRVLTGGSSKKLAQIFSELMEERDD
ncbi:PAP/OAS1 substrate-binding domain-containing protein, partial [Meredithblackwellia eburnea MCA 4105]